MHCIYRHFVWLFGVFFQVEKTEQCVPSHHHCVQADPAVSACLLGSFFKLMSLQFLNLWAALVTFWKWETPAREYWQHLFSEASKGLTEFLTSPILEAQSFQLLQYLRSFPLTLAVFAVFLTNPSADNFDWAVMEQQVFLIAQKTFKVQPEALGTGGSFQLLLFKPFSSAGDVSRRVCLVPWKHVEMVQTAPCWFCS